MVFLLGAIRRLNFLKTFVRALGIQLNLELLLADTKNLS